MYGTLYIIAINIYDQSTLCPPKLTLWNVIYNRKVVTASDVYAHSGQVV